MLPFETYPKVLEKHFMIPYFGTTKLVPYKMTDMNKELLFNMDYKNIILKARKEGISTEVLAIALINCNEIPNYHAVFLADNDPNTTAIFDRVRDFDRNMVGLKMDITITDEGIDFHRTNSQMKVATAGRKSAYRGSDNHFAHMSENAFFKYPEVYEAVLESMADNGIVFIESTANGFNKYEQLWTKAVKGYPKDCEFKPFFFGWNLHPEYKRKDEGFILSADEKDYQKHAKEAFNIDLSVEQMCWRRHKLNGMPDPEKFGQEYPLTPNEAFLATGNPVFNQSQIEYMMNHKRGYTQCNLEISRKGEVAMYQDKFGPWEVYVPPQPGKDYILGADCAEGVADGDFNAIFVLDPDTREQVAQYHGVCDPDQFAYELNKAGRFYNTALVAVERNTYGFGVNSHLLNDYNYPRLYLEDRPTDELITEQSMKYGFRTNTKTRPLMVEIAKKYIRQGLVILNSSVLLNECRTFITNKTGKPTHDTGAHDDAVFAFMITCYILDNFEAVAPQHGMRQTVSYYQLIGKKEDSRKGNRAGY